MDLNDEISKENVQYSKVVPITKFIIVSILSFDLYKFYWVYKNWRDIKYAFPQYKNINPMLRTLGVFFVPIYGIYLLYKQFEIIKDAKIMFKYNILLIITVGLLIECINFLDYPYKIFTVFNFLPYIFIQKELNTLWKSEEINKKKIKLLSPIEGILILVGIFAWLCIYYNLTHIKYLQSTL